MMCKSDKEKVKKFLDENHPDVRDKEYQERGYDNGKRALLRQINEAIVLQSPEDILDYLNSISR